MGGHDIQAFEERNERATGAIDVVVAHGCFDETDWFASFGVCNELNEALRLREEAGHLGQMLSLGIIRQKSSAQVQPTGLLDRDTELDLDGNHKAVTAVR